MKLKFVLVLLFIQSIFVMNPVAGQIANSLTEVIPPSPLVQSIQRFADYPVNLNTGLLQVSIPLYEIKTGSLTLPITLDYHASGCKVNPTISLIGQDWTLNAGGVLSRLTRDIPDGKSSFFTGTLSDVTNMDYIGRQGLLTYTDKLHDVFSYNVGGASSGKFILEHSGTNGMTLTPKHLISKADDISFSFNSPISDFNTFRVVAEDGVIYDFGTFSDLGGIESISGEQITPARTAWWLARMISPNYADTIKFTYQQYYVPYKPSYSETVTLYDGYAGPGVVPSGLPFPSVPWTATDLRYSTPLYLSCRIKEIEFKEGKVVFNSSPDGVVELLQNVQIKNVDNVTLKTIQLNISNFLNPGNSESDYVKLDKLIFKDKNDDDVSEYNFEYYNDSAIGFPATGNVGQSLRSKDWWGYYNGNTGGLIPNSYVNTGAGGNRAPSSDHAKQGMLKKVIYPTSGWAEFVYESNKYGSPSTAGPGLRIQSQSSYDPIANKTIYKTYKYGTNESGSGVLRLLPVPDNSSTKITVLSQTQALYRKRVYSSEFLPALNDFISANIVYPTVTEYYGQINDINGKIVYNYDQTIPVPLHIYPLQANPFSLYQIPTGVINPYVNTYSDDDNLTAPMKVSPSFFYTNEITGKTIFKKEASTYTPIKQISYNYANYNFAAVEEIVLHKYLYLEPDPPSVEATVYDYYIDQGAPVFLQDQQFLYTGSRKLISELEVDKSSGGDIETLTSYEYDNLTHLLPTKIIKQSSDGSISTQRNKYPADFSGITATDNLSKGIRLLQQRNIQNRLIESVNFLTKGANPSKMKSAVFLQTKPLDPYPGNIFQIENQDLITDFSQSSVQSGAVVKDSRYKERISFDSYDSRGNLTQQHKTDDQNLSYLWDYSNTYPVAEVKNSALSAIAYTSFEADSKGSWTYSYADRPGDDGAITGSRCLNVNSRDGDATISKENLESGKRYIISYWSKSTAPFSIVGGTNTHQLGYTVAGWYFHKHIIDASSSTISVIATVPIDELRLYPVSAKMTTYTYDPLIGMTSQCDINNKITYYEYDSFGRLKNILDQDRNVLKTYDYQYQQNNNQ